MARVFMHLVDGTDVLLDPDGIVATADDLPSLALRAARDCIANDVETGWIDLGFKIDVHDEADKVVYSQRFKDAVTIKR